MSVFYFFLQGIPECMGMIALSLAYARVPLRWGYIVALALVISIVSYVIRSLPFTFGFHLPVVMFLVVVFIIRLTKTPPSRSIIAVFFGLATLALLEYLISSTYFAISNSNPQDVIANEGLWTAIGVVQAVILNVIAIIVTRIVKPVEGAWRDESSSIQS